MSTARRHRRTTTGAPTRRRGSGVAWVVCALTAASLCCAPVRAYPYYNGRACGDTAHPTRSEGDHGYNGQTDAITLALYWSARDGSATPQAWESNNQRRMPESWKTNAAGDEYKPGTRLTLVVDLSGLDDDDAVAMVLVTASAGEFEDVGMHEDHDADAGGTALKCGGLRLNPSHMANRHMLLWKAPATAVPVTFRVTSAAGHRKNFNKNHMFASANGALLEPDHANRTDTTSTEPTHDDSTIIGDSSKKISQSSSNMAFAAHGALMFLGIWMFMPGAVVWSRFGRPGPGDKPSAEWLSWHKNLMITATILVIVAAIVAYADVAKLGAEHYDGAHGKLGLAVIIIILVQPVNGFLRPGNPPEGLPKSTKRVNWERFHKSTGYLVLFLGFIAVITGIDELAEKDANFPGGYAIVLFILYVLLFVAVLGIHLFRTRRQDTTVAFTNRARFIELPTTARTTTTTTSSDSVPLSSVP